MRENTNKLIEELKKRSIDIYLVSDMDDHLSEYCGDHFHALEEFSGFTGGDGKLVVTRDGRAFLWTDGRYFIQAEEELKNSEISLMRMGEPGVPTVLEWIEKELPDGGVLGFDGKCTAYKYGRELEKKLKAEAPAGRKKSAADEYDAVRKNKIISVDLCGELWKNRPKEKCTGCWILDEKYCGKPASEKLGELRAEMEKSGADLHAIASLDDIAWLLNMRADDIPCNPVFSSFMLITGSRVFLYMDENHLVKNNAGRRTADIFTAENQNADYEAIRWADIDYLKSIGVELRPYESFYKDIKNVSAYGSSILIDPDRCSYELAGSIPEDVNVIEQMNPTTAAKCRKNAAEIRNLRIAQHKDSAALTKFMYWFKNNLGLTNCFSCAELKKNAAVLKSSRENQAGIGMTEWSCAEKLHELRAEQPGFIEESFSTISAYGANAAMAHYSPSPLLEKTVAIRPYGIYLVDSGGQYPEGTTDVTRTWSCGEISEDESLSFTLTVIANLRLADERFLEGTSGLVIDGAAREVFWRRGLNFNHGTGHGVGFCLNVHEAPVGIRYKASGPESAYPMYEGMYVSDEPGMYVEGRYGIRIENLLLVKHDFTNEYGRFMSFDIMNFCPIDKSCLNLAVMEKRDIELLNAYHDKVYSELCDEMNEEERVWLKNACSPVEIKK